jgi:hypothetical protein
MKVLKCVLASVALSSVLAMPVFATESAIQAREGMQQEREHHPRLVAALKEMRDAKKELEEATSNFGGHKGAAIHALDDAIKQLQLALEFRVKEDNKREH